MEQEEHETHSNMAQKELVGDMGNQNLAIWNPMTIVKNRRTQKPSHIEPKDQEPEI